MPPQEGFLQGVAFDRNHIAADLPVVFSGEQQDIAVGAAEGALDGGLLNGCADKAGGRKKQPADEKTGGDARPAGGEGFQRRMGFDMGDGSGQSGCKAINTAILRRLMLSNAS